MHYKRRQFLRLSGNLAAALALGPVACKLSSNEKKSGEGDGRDTASAGKNAAAGTALASFGLQLYTLRDDMPKDPKGILKQVASFGYKQIESYEGPQGMFWGMSNTDFKKYMDDLGMEIISSHCDINKDFDKKAAESAAIGMKYLVCPWLGPQKKIDDFKKAAEDFNKKGEICRKNGIRFAYHNHAYSFEPIDGQLGQDVMMNNTDPALVDYEMDIYWVATAGQDTEVWLRKYKDRFRLCHVKDRKKGAPLTEHDASCDLGTGSLDYAKLLKTASENGMQYYIVEQEKYEGTTPIRSVEVDAAYMKQLKI